MRREIKLGWSTKSCPTREFTIHMAGDINEARKVLREFCYAEARCFTIHPQTFVYSGGEEEGFVVGVRNYPRFPAEITELNDELGSIAYELADELVRRLCQWSAMIVAPNETVWISRRPEGDKS